MKKGAAISANYEASPSKGRERRLFPFKLPTERKKKKPLSCRRASIMFPSTFMSGMKGPKCPLSETPRGLNMHQ